MKIQDFLGNDPNKLHISGQTPDRRDAAPNQISDSPDLGYKRAMKK